MGVPSFIKKSADKKTTPKPQLNMVFVKKQIIFLIAIIYVTPKSAFACGQCLDQTLDWIAPFILPTFFVACIYLITRRILHIIERLPETVSKPRIKRLIILAISLVVLFFFTLGSMFAGMFVITILALINFIRSCYAARKMAKESPEIKVNTKFQKVFLILWVVSAIASALWSSSDARMFYHMQRAELLRRELVLSHYGEIVFRHEERIKAEIDAACKNPRKFRQKFLSGVFYLSAKLKDPSLAACISKILIFNVENEKYLYDIFLEEGLAALESLDKAILIQTCKAMLESEKFIGRNIENTNYIDGEKLSLILSFLIKNGKPVDYTRFITKDNLGIMEKFRYVKETVKGQPIPINGHKKAIGLDGLPLHSEFLHMGSSSGTYSME